MVAEPTLTEDAGGEEQLADLVALQVLHLTQIVEPDGEHGLEERRARTGQGTGQAALVARRSVRETDDQVTLGTSVPLDDPVASSLVHEAHPAAVSPASHRGPVLRVVLAGGEAEQDASHEIKKRGLPGFVRPEHDDEAGSETVGAEVGQGAVAVDMERGQPHVSAPPRSLARRAPSSSSAAIRPASKSWRADSSDARARARSHFGSVEVMSSRKSGGSLGLQAGNKGRLGARGRQAFCDGDQVGCEIRATPQVFEADQRLAVVHESIPPGPLVGRSETRPGGTPAPPPEPVWRATDVELAAAAQMCLQDDGAARGPGDRGPSGACEGVAEHVERPELRERRRRWCRSGSGHMRRTRNDPTRPALTVTT